MVRHLRLHKVRGHTHLHAEHFKQWLWEVYPVEGTSNPPYSGAVAESSEDNPIHVKSRGYTEGAGMGDPTPDPQG